MGSTSYHMSKLNSTSVDNGITTTQPSLGQHLLPSGSEHSTPGTCPSYSPLYWLSQELSLGSLCKTCHSHHLKKKKKPIRGFLDQLLSKCFLILILRTILWHLQYFHPAEEKSSLKGSFAQGQQVTTKCWDSLKANLHSYHNSAAPVKASRILASGARGPRAGRPQT